MRRNKLFWGINILLLILIFGYWRYPEITVQVNRACSMLAYHDLKGLRMYFAGWGDNAGLLVVLTCFLQILYPPLPKIMPLLAAREIFGWPGMFYAWIGTITAGLLAFAMGRAYLSPIFLGIFRGKNEKIRSIVLCLFIATRFFAWGPLDAMYFVAGMVRIAWKDYILALLFSEWPLLLLVFWYGENIPMSIRLTMMIIAFILVVGVIMKTGSSDNRYQTKKYLCS